MNPLIKWPGGKSGEIGQIERIIPEYDRYIEPFFGGGALFFQQQPAAAAVNDISESLMQFYRLIQRQDPLMRQLLLDYYQSFTELMNLCRRHYDGLLALFEELYNDQVSADELPGRVRELLHGLSGEIIFSFSRELLLNPMELMAELERMVTDKLLRTRSNHLRRPFNDEDLQDNLITGFTSGYFMYFRKVFNDIALGRLRVTPSYESANFYFIREYCYGSMFRYNRQGEFNIPYGGMSYNKKNFLGKIQHLFSEETRRAFANTQIHNQDFEDFLREVQPGPNDFVFLDPPYDSDFSDYEGSAFARRDHQRLAQLMEGLTAQFILIIKNTPFIHNLYANRFTILTFDNRYTYNVRSRNERQVEHLIVTNLPVLGENQLL